MSALLPSGSALTREAILHALSSLSHELGKQGVVGEVCLFGGTVMVLAFTARLSTKNVDALFQPTRLIRELAVRIGAAQRLPVDWLNDEVKGFVSARHETITGISAERRETKVLSVLVQDRLHRLITQLRGFGLLAVFVRIDLQALHRVTGDFGNLGIRIVHRFHKAAGEPDVARLSRGAENLRSPFGQGPTRINGADSGIPGFGRTDFSRSQLEQERLTVRRQKQIPTTNAGTGRAKGYSMSARLAF